MHRCLFLILLMLSTCDARADDPAGMLSRFAGVWRTSGESKPAKWPPKEMRMTSVATRQWILNERFLLDNSSHADGEESLALFGHDPQGREYRTWWFNSEGRRNSSRGKWNPGTRTLSFESQLEQDRVSRSTVRLISPDKRELNLKITDATGKVFYDSTITVTKRETEKRNIE